MKTTSTLLKAATLSVALIGGTAIVTMTVSPDSAWAGNGNGKGGGSEKSDRGNGGGKDASSRGNGGGRDKADRGNGGSRNKADRGNGGKSKSDRQSARGNGKSKNKSGGSKSASKRSKKQPATLSELGRDIKRDVKSLFGRDTQTKRTRTTKRKQASVEPLETSPRPASRDLATRPESKPEKKRVRDPLVAAITDPDGSDKLRNLSASKAAAAAFQNASANSNVGKIATYQAAAEEYYELRDDLREARGELRELDESYDGRSSEEIEKELAELEPGDPGYDELQTELEEAKEYEDARAELTDDIKDLRTETGDALEVAEEAFFDASKGRTVTRDTLSEFHNNLGLPEPKTTGEKDEAEVLPDHEYSDDATETEIDDAEIADTSEPREREHRRTRKSRDPLVSAITDPDGSDKLRNLNASKAASAAFANASPNSNVGRIASYQQAAEDYYELRDDLADARRDLRDFEDSYDGRSSEEIQADIDDLNPGDEGYEDAKMVLEEELMEAEEFEEARDDLQDGVRDLRTETLIASKEAEEAFNLASKGEILTTEALAELHNNLGLPAPSE